jgi:hypothetical protein
MLFVNKNVDKIMKNSRNKNAGRVTTMRRARRVRESLCGE